MLSTNVIKSVDKAGHYFSQQDNYYTHEEGLEHSEWWGRSAEKLNLYGKVNGKQFTDFLQGKLPSGEQLGKVVEGAIKHRPGWDLTFSAPKSVSILALIGGDKRLIEAHREAVSEALSYVEKNCSQARIKSAGEIKHQNTNNLVASLFHHDLSRAKDPQLHTHSVVMNMTERSDGKWRSLASQIGKYGETAQGEVNGFIERVRHHNRFFSKVYEAELAYRVKQLGYEITTDTKSGIFEIKGVPKEVIQCFSKRRAEIETELAYKGLSGGKAAAIATLNTRDAKNEVDRVLLKEKWDQQISQLGIDLASLVKTKEDVDEIANKLTVDPDQGIIEAVKQIAKTLSVFKTTFTLEEVVTYLSDHAIRHHVPFKKIINAINTQIANQELISIENEQGKTVLMARSSLLEEKRLFAQLQQNKSIIPTVYDSKLMQILEKNKEINSDYHEPLKNIFGNDSIVLLEGENTKNELIKPIINIAKSAKLEIAILSPSLIGSKQFAQRVKASPKNI
ncbi:MAG TPA: MobF family relaxase, partial [Gammaproteobacteria bacterium]|nr:MobF family relaxase [Gammaproteobacteria bacterium]